MPLRDHFRPPLDEMRHWEGFQLIASLSMSWGCFSSGAKVCDGSLSCLSNIRIDVM